MQHFLYLRNSATLYCPMEQIILRAMLHICKSIYSQAIRNTLLCVFPFLCGVTQTYYLNRILNFRKLQIAWKAVPDWLFHTWSFAMYCPPGNIKDYGIPPAHSRFTRMYGVTHSIAFQAIHNSRNFKPFISHYLLSSHGNTWYWT